MESNNCKLLLRVSGVDDESTEALTYQLRNELKEESGVRAIVPGGADQPLPSGAKGVDAQSFSLGLMWVEATLKSLPLILTLLDAWAKRGKSRHLTLTVESSGRKVTVDFNPDKDSAKDIKKLINELLTD